MSAVRLPRDSTRQAEGMLYGAVARQMNRWTGLYIAGFVVVHVINEATLRIQPRPDVLVALHALDAQLAVRALLHSIEGLLYFAVGFHFLYGVKLMAMDLGARPDARLSFWSIVAVCAIPAIWQVVTIGRI